MNSAEVVWHEQKNVTRKTPRWTVESYFLRVKITFGKARRNSESFSITHETDRGEFLKQSSNENRVPNTKPIWVWWCAKVNQSFNNDTCFHFVLRSECCTSISFLSINDDLVKAFCRRSSLFQLQYIQNCKRNGYAAKKTMLPTAMQHGSNKDRWVSISLTAGPANCHDWWAKIRCT